MDSNKNHMKIPFEDWKKFDVNWSKNRLEEIKEPKKNDAEENTHDTDDESLESNRNATSSLQDTHCHENNTDHLNNGQKQVYDLAMSPLSNSEQVFLLVCGGPGTGKTFKANTIIKHLSSQNIQSHAFSFM